MDNHQEVSAPSSIVETVTGDLLSCSSVLDLACGGGRNGRHLLTLGHDVSFLDRNIDGVADLAGQKNASLIQADLEDGSDWPLGCRQFDLVIVSNYLWRPILRHIFNSVKVGGTIVYETFAIGNEMYGRPSNPKFLLLENELITSTSGQYDIRRFSSGQITKPKLAIKQSMIATRKPANFEESRDDFEISDDPLRIDDKIVHNFITNSYWAKGIVKEKVEKSISGSQCLGLYAPDGQQIGFARSITDSNMLAYLADIFVMPNYRGKKFGKWLTDALMRHPTHIGIKRFLLATQDAHGLYQQLGFVRLENTNMMYLENPNWPN